MDKRRTLDLKGKLDRARAKLGLKRQKGFDPKAPVVGKPARRQIADLQRRAPELRKRPGQIGTFSDPVQHYLDRAGVRPDDKRAAIVRAALWGVANTVAIHYDQVRPIPHRLELPMRTDCSGFATLCYQIAGAADPNGRGYDGEGYTGTLNEHGTVVKPRDARPGDLCLYGVAPCHHVTIVVEADPDGGDPLEASHGYEAGPLLVRHSTEAASQAANGHTMSTFRSYL